MTQARVRSIMIVTWVSLTVLIVWALLECAARADTLTTADRLVVDVGCWNPATCADPALYWHALGLDVPAVEPPAADFAPVGEPMLIDWVNASPSWFVDAPWPSGPGPAPFEPAVATTPEPSTFTLALVAIAGVALVSWMRRR